MSNKPDFGTLNNGCETLVQLVVSRALVDKTQPDPQNLSIGWRTDQLLTQDIDALVIGQCQWPGLFAEIGRRVLEQISHLPEIAILARLAIFRGERLRPINDEREKKLAAMAEEILKKINALPDSKRKSRCESLYFYHAGVFYDACGKFYEASNLQSLSSAQAKSFGDQVGEAIADFLQVFYLLKNAITTKQGVLQQLFDDLLGAYKALCIKLANSALYVQWAQYNCPIHLFQACVWQGVSHPDQDKWNGLIVESAPKLGEAYKPGADFVKAFREADPDKQVDLFEEVAENATGDLGATALLVLARNAMAHGQKDEAADYYKRMPHRGAQHVLKIAERMLTVD